MTPKGSYREKGEASMSQIEFLREQFIKRRISRREFAGRLVAAGVGATVLPGLITGAAKAQTPQKGGRISGRVGAERTFARI